MQNCLVLGNCYDIFPDCVADMLADPTYCSGQEAFRGCQDSCDFCASRVTPPPGETSIIS